ncbi:MAG TPA: hypothetical protein VFA84_15620 [Acidimicrobiales bacterium]|nr:hypothetical protein [Acidimicrobiales bacterium]
MSEAPYVDPGPRSGAPDALVLDIGGEIGALVVHAPPSWIGTELDVTAEGEPRSHHRHLLVRRLHAGGHDVVAGVLPSLPAGAYTVWGPSGSPVASVSVSGGTVATVSV